MSSITVEEDFEDWEEEPPERLWPEDGLESLDEDPEEELEEEPEEVDAVPALFFMYSESWPRQNFPIYFF